MSAATSLSSTVKRTLGAPPEQRRGLAYVARMTGLAIYTLRRRIASGSVRDMQRTGRSHH